MSLFGSGMGSTGANMIAKNITGKLFATTSREWQLCQCEYLSTDTSAKGLSETSRPGLIPAMRSNYPEKIQRSIPQNPLWGILFLRLEAPISVRKTESSTGATMRCCVRRPSCSARRETSKLCLRSLNGCQCLIICWVTLCCARMAATLEASSPRTM